MNVEVKTRKIYADGVGGRAVWVEKKDITVIEG